MQLLNLPRQLSEHRLDLGPTVEMRPRCEVAEGDAVGVEHLGHTKPTMGQEFFGVAILGGVKVAEDIGGFLGHGDVVVEQGVVFGAEVGRGHALATVLAMAEVVVELREGFGPGYLATDGGVGELLVHEGFSSLAMAAVSAA